MFARTRAEGMLRHFPCCGRDGGKQVSSARSQQTCCSISQSPGKLKPAARLWMLSYTHLQIAVSVTCAEARLLGQSPFTEGLGGAPSAGFLWPCLCRTGQSSGLPTSPAGLRQDERSGLDVWDVWAVPFFHN